MELKGEEENGDEKLELEAFEFFLITHVNGDYTRTDLSGVIGLGAPQNSNPDWPTTSFVESLYKAGQINSPVFSIYMCLEGEGTPSVTFGDTNSGYLKPNVTGANHTAVTIDGYESLWATGFTDMKLNGTSLANGGGKAIFDTGTYAIQLGSSAYASYKKQIEALNNTFMDCAD